MVIKTPLSWAGESLPSSTMVYEIAGTSIPGDLGVLGPTPRISGSLGLGQGLQFAFPRGSDDADTPGP